MSMKEPILRQPGRTNLRSDLCYRGLAEGLYPVLNALRVQQLIMTRFPIPDGKEYSVYIEKMTLSKANLRRNILNSLSKSLTD